MTARSTTWRLSVCAALMLSAVVLYGDDFQVIRYDDCGTLGKQPHVLNGGVWTFEEARVSAPLPARTVAFDGEAVHVRYQDLLPSAHYRLRVEYTTERDQARTQTLSAGDVPIHGELALPQGEAKTFEFEVPQAAVARGTLDLYFHRVVGPNAVVSELWLLSDVPQPELDAKVDSDLRGALAVTASDGAFQPLVRAEVTVTGPGDLKVSAFTGADGVARFDLAKKLPADLAGELTVKVTFGNLTATRTLAVDAVLFRRPVLTPIPDSVAGVHTPSLSLCGRWRFSPAPPARFWDETCDDAAWPPIEVPGEWVMQGFTVQPKSAAGYRTTFRVPENWRGHSVRIRFDAVFSQCTAWLNGQRVGAHEGGFTPFEVDVTRAVRPGRENVLALAVTSEGLADTLASASSYARHALGGITRKVTAFVVPELHLSRFQVETRLDRDYHDATLVVLDETAAGPAGTVPAPSQAILRLSLRDPQGRSVPLTAAEGAVSTDGRLELRVPVPQAQLWDVEHPRLYDLLGELVVAGKLVERVSRRIGFRQVGVRGAELLVNGHPVKLHGTCRHEVDPDRGRSLTPAMWQRDVELLKGANINHVRTSHYPPAEEFIDLCDEAGIFVQEEGPWCWVSSDNASSPSTLGLMLRSNAEMLERDRSHPSVIIWDIANESSWGENFRRLHEYTRAEDPSRPTLFSGAGDADPAHGRPDGTCEIGSWHYPGPGFTPNVAQSKRPVTFDEYCHLNCYNAAEVSLDPGLRDYWGRALQPMWDEMQKAPACLGGSIWCWADDLFNVPKVGRVGYGEWGIVDGTRRPKPEWWHVKKSYSPVRVAEGRLDDPRPGEPLVIPVENRFDFTNLNEIRCEWTLGARKGVLTPDIPPRTAGRLAIPCQAKTGDTLGLRFTDRTGRVIDQYALPVGQLRVEEPGPPPPCPELREKADAFEVVGSGFVVTVERATGRMRASVNGVEVLRDGPRLAASKLGTAEDVFVDAGNTAEVSAEIDAVGVRVRLRIVRNTNVGPITYRVDIVGDGRFDVSYEAKYAGADANVREIGLLWSLPPEFDRLSWERQGQWTVYPDDHIGRLLGSAVAGPPPGDETLPRSPSWSLDPDPRGTNDFRSTKYDVGRASLTNAAGIGLESSSNVRATRESDHITWRISDFANGGGEGFLNAHYAAERRIVKAGETLRGRVSLRLLRSR